MGDEDPADVEERREIFEIISRALPTDPSLLREKLSHSVREGGKVTPPLVLMAGELRFPFDELKRLEATIAACTPFASGDELLSAALEDGSSFLQTPNLLSGPGVSEALTKRITKAFERTSRQVPDDYLAEQTQRALLGARHYQLRELFGASQIRATFHPEHASDSKKGIPIYILADLATDLPLFANFPARVIVELCLREDQYEAHPACLKLLALARAVARPSW